MCEIFSFKLSNQRTIAALADVEYGVVRNVVHESDAACAQNAAVWNVENVTAEIFDRIEPLRLAIARISASFLIGEVLQLAFARLITDGTIERVIDEQKLEHALSSFESTLVVNVNDLPFGHRFLHTRYRAWELS